jgi:hypothetical protein
MRLFRQREASPASRPAPAVPPPDLTVARQVVAALVQGQATDAQMRHAIRSFVEASGTPVTPEARMRVMRDDPGVHHRPWRWLVAVSELAVAAGDVRTACLAGYWSMRFNRVLAPQMQLGDFMDLGLDPAPKDAQERLAALGLQAAQALPADELLAGDGSDGLTAGMLLQVL